MAAGNRGAQITKVHKVLLKHFKPAAPPVNRSMLDHLIYAGVLQNAAPEEADKAFLVISSNFFDLNEVRVSSVRELMEALSMLPDSQEAARRVRSLLQSVFEAHYAFDLEPLRKQNLGQAVKRLEKYEGSNEFIVNYMTQVALGGHAIPVNEGAVQAMHILGVISDSEKKHGKVPGLERAIPKKKGIEFGSLLQQFGSLITRSPLSPVVRKILLEIDPDCKDRLPKRASPKKEEPAPVPPPPPAKAAAKNSKPAPAPAPAAKKPEPKKVEKKPEPKKPEKADKKALAGKLARKKPR